MHSESQLHNKCLVRQRQGEKWLLTAFVFPDSKVHFCVCGTSSRHLQMLFSDTSCWFIQWKDDRYKPSKYGVNTNGASRLKYFLLAFPSQLSTIPKQNDSWCISIIVLNCFKSLAADICHPSYITVAKCLPTIQSQRWCDIPLQLYD